MKRSLVVLFAALMVAPLVTEAGVPKPERKMIRDKLQGTTLYLRVDAPCVIGRQPFGIYHAPLVEVSPTGLNTQEHEGGFGFYHADSAYWGIQVNDPVRLEEMEFDGDVLEAEFIGVKEAEDEVTVIKFIGINSFADFERAFEHVFSTQPLQYLHDDWSDEIKTAISDRRLLEGMNKRQVYYVTGAPESFERSQQDGREVETWKLRQHKGMKMGFFGISLGGTPGAMPETLRFEDGALVNVVGKGTGSGLSLDD